MQGEFITMSYGEVTRLEVIQKVSEKWLKQGAAAKMLGISTRQIKRLLRYYKSNGAKGLISKKRDKPSNRRHSKAFRAEIMALVREHYFDFGPKFAAEKLLERHMMQINKETLRQWMMEAALWNGKHRKNVTLHQQRSRRSCFGELVQIDGSHHDWFEGRRDQCCLLVFIDDATSRLLALRFEEQETTLGYFNATRSYINRHGRPVSFYSDKYGVFRVNAVEAKGGSGETQFGRAMRELGIKIIFANSPEAKGRVERVNATLQDRLVKELRLRGINDIETANAFLPEYVQDHNQRFAVSAADSNDAHRTVLPTDNALDLIFTIQCERTLSKNLELSYQNMIYQVQSVNQGYRLRHAKITICDDQKGCVTLLHKGKPLKYTTLDKKNRASEAVDRKALSAMLQKEFKKDGRSLGHKPKANHPWRQYDLVAKRKNAKNGARLSTGSTSLAGV